MKIKTLVAVLLLSGGVTSVLAQEDCNKNSSISHEAVRASNFKDASDGFCVGLAGQPGLFQFGTGLFGNDVHNIVVIIDFGTGHCGKHRKCFDPIGRFGGIRTATCR